MMVIEFARNVLGYVDANSREMDEKTPHNVIDIMEEQKNITQMGGTMRLGAYECDVREGSKTFEAYGQKQISERHRHRYEFNNQYIKEYEKSRHAMRRYQPRQQFGGDCGNPGIEMVHRYTIPSGIQQYGTQTASLVPFIRKGSH